MLISLEVPDVSPHVELIRSGLAVTLELHGGANGYYDPELGYWLWDGDISATLGSASDYFYQDIDRPLDMTVTETLVPATVTEGSYEINYGEYSASFGVILFTSAANYTGTAGIDYAFGSEQADRLSGGAGDDGLEGGVGDDWLNGGEGRDILDGEDGRDSASYANAAGAVIARLYNATLNAGEAAGDRFISIENLEGSHFKDRLYGDAKANGLWGRDGADALFGLNGNDVLVGGKGADLLLGDAGIDTASYAGATGRVASSLLEGGGSAGEAAGDVYWSIENLTGSSFGDALFGDAQTNTLRGGAGNDDLRGLAGGDKLIGESGDDVLTGGAGADQLNGGGGIDTASYASATYGVRASLSNSGANTRDAAGDAYVSVENLTGSPYSDRLTGDERENLLSGSGGNDIISGGEGFDGLRGGGGADIFVFDSAFDPLSHVDRILDYTVADDRMWLDSKVFTALTAGGSIGAAAFHTGSAAATADHRIIYNAANGLILYDVDGTGGASAVAFARVAAGLTIAAAEFLVI